MINDTFDRIKIGPKWREYLGRIRNGKYKCRFTEETMKLGPKAKLKEAT